MQYAINAAKLLAELIEKKQNKEFKDVQVYPVGFAVCSDTTTGEITT